MLVGHLPGDPFKRAVKEAAPIRPGKLMEVLHAAGHSKARRYYNSIANSLEPHTPESTALKENFSLSLLGLSGGFAGSLAQIGDSFLEFTIQHVAGGSGDVCAIEFWSELNYLVSGQWLLTFTRTASQTSLDAVITTEGCTMPIVWFTQVC